MTSNSLASLPSSRGLWLAVGLFSAVLNPLMLTGSLFMLQVYDRVLPSGSVPTLMVLFALVGFAHAVMALLDAARARLMLRIGGRIQAAMAPRVIAARGVGLARDPPDPRAAVALDDLDSAQRALSSPAFLALFDTPWAFAFLALLFLFHPAMGALALTGGVGLVGLGAWSRWRQHRWQSRASDAATGARAQSSVWVEQARLIAALGMGPAMMESWLAMRTQAQMAALQAADRQAFDAAAGRAFRLFMQSAILALGGYLVLQGQLSPGLIVAASILLGRALAPVENLSAHWAQLRAARAGWRRLNGFLDSTTAETGSALAQGQGDLTVRHLVVAAPGKGPVLQVEGFCVAPGQALGVIGPSGAGKSALAQAILGVAPVVAGQARLGIAALPGAMPVGYLPQTATLFAGTIAQNIARFAVDPDLSEVEHVSRMVGLHDHVMRLGRGYETCLASNQAAIPQGVVQRIALARAFYGAPRVVILDDPNAHLDADGVAALNRTIRAFKADGAIVVVMANRPSGISECDDLLVLDAGRQVAYGPRDKVLREVVRNHTTLIAPNAQAVQG